MSTARWMGLLAVMTAAFATPALADRIHLKNGHIFYGRIVEQDEVRVRVKFDYGDMEFERDQIERIEVESDMEYALSQGDVYLSRKQFDKAAAMYEKARELLAEPNVVRGKLHALYMTKADTEARARRYGAAAVSYEKALEYDGANQTARVNAEKYKAFLEEARKQVGELKSDIAAGRFEKAAAAAETLFAEAPDASPELYSLAAVAYAQWGNQQYAAKAWAPATDAFRRCLEFDPKRAQDVAVRLMNAECQLAYAAVSKGEYTVARDRMTYIASMFPTEAYPKYLLGFCHEKLRQDKAARSEYLDILSGKVSRGSQTLSTERLRGMVEEALGFTSKEPKEQAETDPANWQERQFTEAQRMETEHFVIHYFNEFVANSVARTAEYHLERQAADMMVDLDGGESWTRKCEIFIYPDKQTYVEKGLAKDWSGGNTRVRFNNNALVESSIATYQDSPALINAVLPHEINHLLLHVRLGELRTAYPTWLMEGYAVTVEPAFRKAALLQKLAERMESDTLLPLDDMVRDRNYPASEEDITLFYAQSYALVNMLLETSDETTFLMFAQKAKDNPILQALSEVYGIADDNALQNKWKAYIRKFAR